MNISSSTNGAGDRKEEKNISNSTNGAGDVQDMIEACADEERNVVRVPCLQDTISKTIMSRKDANTPIPRKHLVDMR